MKPSRRAASLSVAAALLAALAGRAGAQQQEAALPAVTLDDAVKLALEHSPLMVQARGSVREADAETRSSWGAFLPTLSLSSGASRASSTRFNSATNTVVSGSAASYTAGLSGGLDIFSGGRRTAVLRQARAASDAADASLVQQRYQVALNAESGFFDVLRAADLIRVAQSQVQMAQEQLDASNQRLKVGSATRSDVLRAQLSLTQANQALAQA